MHCPNCGAELPKSATVCTFCSTEILNQENKTEDNQPLKETVKLELSTNAMEVILPEKKKKNKRKKYITIIASVLVVAVIAVSLGIEMSRRLKNKETEETGKSTSSLTQSTQSSDKTVVKNTSATFIKRDQSRYYRTIIIYREEEKITAIEYSYSTSANTAAQGEFDEMVKRYTNYFKEQNYDSRYITTKVLANSDEFKATIKILNLNIEGSQQYLNELKIFDFYKVGMTFTEFVKNLENDGYKIK